MELTWFYIAVVLACSDLLHDIVWHEFKDFYIVLGEIIYNIVKSPYAVWVCHEVIEAIFHFVVLSLVFQSLTIGVLAAAIHFVIDIGHTYYDIQMPPIIHRALHFVIESIFFMIVLAL